MRGFYVLRAKTAGNLTKKTRRCLPHSLAIRRRTGSTGGVAGFVGTEGVTVESVMHQKYENEIFLFCPARRPVLAAQELAGGRRGSFFSRRTDQSWVTSKCARPRALRAARRPTKIHPNLLISGRRSWGQQLVPHLIADLPMPCLRVHVHAMGGTKTKFEQYNNQNDRIGKIYRLEKWSGRF